MSEVVVAIQGAVGRITLNRPDRMNAVNVALARTLADAVDDLANAEEVGVIVIRGAGGNFCAGGDFDEVQRLRSRGADDLRVLFTEFGRVGEAIARAPIPVVAAVEGAAAAGGFELMQAVDIVLVADDARISDSHIKFGMIPGGGSTARLPRLVGRQTALALLLSGDHVSGLDAVRLGLAYTSYPRADFDDSVELFVTRLASRDRVAATTIKRLVTDGLNGAAEQAIANEVDAVVRHICGTAGQSGVASFEARKN